MADTIIAITGSVAFLDPDKYAPNRLVVLLPDSVADNLPDGFRLKIINNTPSSTEFVVRASGTDKVQDINVPTATPATDSLVKQGWYRIEYVMQNGVWRIAMLYIPPDLEDITGSGAVVLDVSHKLLFDGATTSSITIPNSLVVYEDARVGFNEIAGDNSDIAVICQGTDTIELPDQIGTYQSTFNLHWPHSYFEYQVHGTQWKLIEKLPRDPRIGSGIFTPLTNVGLTYTTTLSYVIQQHGKQNVYINLNIQWVSPGGNPVMDWNAQWTINGVPQDQRQFYNSNKPATTVSPYSISPWLDTLVPGDLIEIQIKNNNGVGQLNTLTGTLQLMGPFI